MAAAGPPYNQDFVRPAAIAVAAAVVEKRATELERARDREDGKKRGARNESHVEIIW